MILIKNKWLYLLFVVCLYACDFADKKTNELDQQNNVGVDTIIRNIKFNIYCIYTDVKFAFIKDTSKLIDYSECDIKIDTISTSLDTLDFAVHYIYKGKLIRENELIENGNRIIARVLYDIKKNRIVEYYTNWNLGFYEVDSKSRYFEPLQPEVRDFIKKNQDKINPWFKAEAKRREII